MRVIVEGTALEGRADRAQHLPALFSIAARGRHDVLVHPDAQEEWLAWLEQRDPVSREVYRRAEQDSQGHQALAPSMLEIRVADPDTSDWAKAPPELHVLDALDLLEIPLEILVEDETSDGAFLDCVVPPLFRPAWKEARTQRRARLSNVGGVTQVPRRLQGDRAEPPLSTRSFLLIDSDAPEPWIDPAIPIDDSWNNLPNATKKAVRAADKVGIPAHVLERRMAENYLPAAALAAWVASLHRSHQINKKPHVDHFEQLPPDRQHHHHLKDGLRPNESGLYGNLSATARAALDFSLGRFTWKAFAYATDADLRNYGVHRELTPLFQRLLGAL